ncbi:NYN domain-containing protein [Pseudochrobactrum lubricantis]|uniref:NYN domain-containing protein n=1 Tax=Pseudochrobactrum lubricantis TaxID=558172 RepID=UPI0035DA354C
MRQIIPSQKCCVLIDGGYVDRLSKSARFDFIKFVEFLRSKYQLVNVVYFSVVPFYNDVFPKRKLLDWLSYNGFIVKEKATKKKNIDSYHDLEGSVSLDIVLHAFEACEHTDGFVFVTDDPDMCAAIFALQRKNKWIALVGAELRSGIRLSDDLRRAADVCLSLSAISAHHSTVEATTDA